VINFGCDVHLKINFILTETKYNYMDKLRFGTAGIPISTENPNTVNGIKRVRELSLDSMELEFVRSINVSKEKAPEVKNVAKENDVVLTCHAPYYINLNSKEEPKIHASVNRIIQSARIAWLCGGYSVCFHAAYYMKMDSKAVYNRVKDSIKKIIETLQNEGNKIWVRPETTGKLTQFGDLDEILNLSSEIDQVMPCVDFSHFHARTNGKFNTYEEFSEILQKIENVLGREGLGNMHIHVSGIEYGDKGEKNHLNLKDSDMNYQELMKAFKDFNIKGVVISESPNIESDALLMKQAYLNC
jgi:deoxyribonuclease-4